MELVIYEPSILTKIHQKQQIFLFDGLINKTIVIEQEGKGTGGILWPASELLSNCLNNPISVFQPIKYFNIENKIEWNWENKTILEFGSGLGLTSIILASLGAKVIATDGEETVVDQLSKNFDLNLDSISRKNVISCVYRWGDNIQTIFDCLSDTTTNNNNEWVKKVEPFSFDIILAADVVYGEDPYIWSLLQQSLQTSSSLSTTSSSPSSSSSST